MKGSESDSGSKPKGEGGRRRGRNGGNKSRGGSVAAITSAPIKPTLLLKKTIEGSDAGATGALMPSVPAASEPTSRPPIPVISRPPSSPALPPPSNIAENVTPSNTAKMRNVLQVRSPAAAPVSSGDVPAKSIMRVAVKKAPIAQPVSLLSPATGTFNVEGTNQLLLDVNTDYTAVGFIGLRGAGKSHLIKELIGSSDLTNKARPGTTCNYELYVTADRLIVIDSPPLLDLSTLIADRDDASATDKTLLISPRPSSFADYDLKRLEVFALHQLMWMLASCNVVVIVTDHVVEPELHQLLSTAYMLLDTCPRIAEGHSAKIIYVVNKDDCGALSSEHVDQILQPALFQLFAPAPPISTTPVPPPPSTPPFRSDGEVAGRRTSPGPVKRSGRSCPVPHVLVPRLAPRNSNSVMEDEAGSDFAVNAYADAIRTFRKTVLGLRRSAAFIPSGGRGMSEKEWLKNAVKLFDKLKRCETVTSYAEMLFAV